jgi:hypothetical protein
MMTVMVEVKIEDPNELRALHRMLFTRKFDGPTDEFFGSPFIASVQRRIAAALRTLEGASWDEWADARRHDREVQRVRAHLSDAGPWWASAQPNERRQRVLDLLSPLDVPPDLLADLIST